MTGVAATQLKGGTTIDKRLGLRRHDDPLKALSTNKKKTLETLWGEAAGILIDEISMADSHMVVRFNRALRCITGCDRPFGGVHVIWSGDFNQKPPVAGGQSLYSPRSSRTRQYPSRKRSVQRPGGLCTDAGEIEPDHSQASVATRTARGYD